jgi:ribonuclease BN (tRNA processing enzyme)
MAHATDQKTTRVVMLGTGTPRPDPDRSGPATAIVVKDTPYLVDFGPGVIRRAAAAYQKGVTALGVGASNLRLPFSPTCIPITPWAIPT